MNKEIGTMGNACEKKVLGTKVKVKLFIMCIKLSIEDIGLWTGR